MSYDQKVCEVRELLSNHNSQVPEDSSKIDIEAFFTKLANIGGTTEEVLTECKWEDLEACGLPRLLCRKVATIFRGDKKEEKPAYVKMSAARGMSLRQLIEAYDPREFGNNVGTVLAEKAKDEAFIVFDDNGKVIVDSSLQLLEEIRDGHSARESFVVNGSPYPVYSIGDTPDRLGDVNPLYAGECLRNGDCSQTSRSWNGVEKEIRQIIFLARTQTNELPINNPTDAHNILDIVKSDGAKEKITLRFPKAVMKLRELRNVGNEPSLKMPIGKRENSPNDPFFSSGKNRKY